MGVPATPEDNEDLSEYNFAKFAATYFQVNHIGTKIFPFFKQVKPGFTTTSRNQSILGPDVK